MQRKLLPGKPYPLGAKASFNGTNFSLYTEHATAHDGFTMCNLVSFNKKHEECVKSMGLMLNGKTLQTADAEGEP